MVEIYNQALTSSLCLADPSFFIVQATESEKENDK